jgi:hypothetical protein
VQPVSSGRSSQPLEVNNRGSPAVLLSAAAAGNETIADSPALVLGADDVAQGQQGEEGEAVRLGAGIRGKEKRKAKKEDAANVANDNPVWSACTPVICATPPVDQSEASPGHRAATARGRQTGGDGAGVSGDLGLADAVAREEGALQRSVHSGNRAAGTTEGEIVSLSSAPGKHVTGYYASAGRYSVDTSRVTTVGTARFGVTSTAYQDANQKVAGFNRRGVSSTAGDGASDRSDVGEHRVADGVDSFGDRIDGRARVVKNREEGDAEAEDIAEQEMAEADAPSGSDSEDESDQMEAAIDRSSTPMAAGVVAGGGSERVSPFQPPPPPDDAGALAECDEEAAAKAGGSGLPPDSVHPRPGVVSTRRSFVRSSVRSSYTGPSDGGGHVGGEGSSSRDSDATASAAGSQCAKRGNNAVGRGAGEDAAATAAANASFAAPAVAPPPPVGGMAPGLRRQLASSPDADQEDEGELGELLSRAGGAGHQPRHSASNSERALVLGSNHELAPLVVSGGLTWKGLRGRLSLPSTGRERECVGGKTATPTPAAAATPAELGDSSSTRRLRHESTVASAVGRRSSARGRTVTGAIARP